MSLATSKLGGMLKGHRDQLTSCVKLLLLWVAASDGNLDDSELEFASERFPDAGETVTVDDLLALIQSADISSIEMALRLVAGESRELRASFLDLAITMSMADHIIAITENHILRFYADALYLGSGILEKRFQAITGKALAEPGDPSDPDWWGQLTESDYAALRNSDFNINAQLDDKRFGKGSHENLTVEQARKVLGVGPDASAADIRRSFETLSSIFNSDHIESMGEAAMAVAKKRYRKIQDAFQLLGGEQT